MADTIRSLCAEQPSFPGKSYRFGAKTGIETGDAEAFTRRYEYYDPVYTLPASGQDWWRKQAVSAR